VLNGAREAVVAVTVTSAKRTCDSCRTQRPSRR
jgi:hypothetical protein